MPAGTQEWYWTTLLSFQLFSFLFCEVEVAGKWRPSQPLQQTVTQVPTEPPSKKLSLKKQSWLPCLAPGFTYCLFTLGLPWVYPCLSSQDFYPRRSLYLGKLVPQSLQQSRSHLSRYRKRTLAFGTPYHCPPPHVFLSFVSKHAAKLIIASLC